MTPSYLTLARREVVPPEPLSGDWDLTSQLPSGMTLVDDNQWTAQWGSGWDIATNRSGPAPSIGTDSSQPETSIGGSSVKTGSAVLVQPYGGTADGEEPQFPFRTWSASREVFASAIVKFADTWVQPTSSGIKWHLFDGTQFLWFGLGNSSTTSGWPRIAVTTDTGTSSPTSSRYDWPVNSGQTAAATMEPGQWYKLSYLMRRGSPGDNLTIWVNDVKVLDTDDQGGVAWSSGTHTWNGVQLGATWGGGIGFTAPSGNTIYYARTAFWRRA
jgi:hypothetical protein